MNDLKFIVSLLIRLGVMSQHRFPEVKTDAEWFIMKFSI